VGVGFRARNGREGGLGTGLPGMRARTGSRRHCFGARCQRLQLAPLGRP
jgi:hypothetical protein